MSRSLVYTLIFMMLGIISCSPPPAPTLNKDQKKVVDSLYRKGLDSIKKDIQLVCDERHTSIYQHAIDSIQDLRKEEFESILAQ